MTLIEAINSRRPFDSIDGEETSLVLWSDITGNAFLAKSDNWEIRRPVRCADLTREWKLTEPKTTITQAQFFEAYGQVVTQTAWAQQPIDTAFAIALAKQLGLESVS